MAAATVLEEDWACGAGVEDPEEGLLEEGPARERRWSGVKVSASGEGDRWLV